MRQQWLLTGLLIIVLALVAACGDDDDDDDVGLDTDDVTETVVVDGDETEEDAEVTVEGGTATAADGVATPTEDEAVTTETEDGTPTEDAVATGTEDEADVTETEVDVTGTEEEVDGTVTETEADGTVAETEVDGTATETDGTAEATGTEVDGTAPEDEGTAEIGEPIEVGDAVLTVEEAVVLDATTIGEFGDILGLEEGNQFLGVSMMVENAGSDPMSVSELLGRIRIEDGDGEEYGVDLGATALALLSGEFENVSQIEAGEEVPLMLGFQVPEDVQVDDLTLVIEPEDETGEPTRVPLDEASS